MKKKLKRICFIFLCFLLCFEQSGFAQVAAQLDISAHLAGLHNSFFPDKFRPLHLRYISYDALNNNFKLLLDKGDLRIPPKVELEEKTKTLLNYFFIGISLPNDSFWVNLRPDAEDNIIDPELAKTDVGKILLEADLQLKKDTAKFTSPETLEGKQYWDKLYQKAGELFGSENITIPTLTRPWIVPDEIIIREAQDNAYIYKATLKVMLEQDYLKNSAMYSFKDERLKQLNEYSSQLIRELIIPKLTKEVNTSKRYAPLRQVYYSLILAQWFKQRFYGKGGLYSSLIDRRNLNGLTSKAPWSKTTYFQAYQASFKDGEYNIKEPAYTPYGQTIRSYFSGGIALSAFEAIKTGLVNGARGITEKIDNIFAKLEYAIGAVYGNGQLVFIEAGNGAPVRRPKDREQSPIAPNRNLMRGDEGNRGAASAPSPATPTDYFPGYERLSVRGVLIKAEEAFNRKDWNSAISFYREALYGKADTIDENLTYIATEYNDELRKMATSYIRIAHERVMVCKRNLGHKTVMLPEKTDIEKVTYINFEPILLPNGEPVVFSGEVSNLGELRKAFFVFIKQFHENFWEKFEPYLRLDEAQCRKEIEKINQFSVEAYCIQLLRLLLRDTELRNLLFEALLSSHSNGVFEIKNTMASDLKELGYNEDWMIVAEVLFYYLIYNQCVTSMTAEEKLLFGKIDDLIRNTKGYDTRNFKLNLNKILRYQLWEAKILPYQGPYKPLSFMIFRVYGYNPEDPLKIIFDLYRYYTATYNVTPPEAKAVSLSHVFSALNGIFYNAKPEGLKDFFSMTTAGYDPQTAYANADEFHQYLCGLDRNPDYSKRVPKNFYIEEWGIGNGNFAKHFLDRLRTLDEQHGTDYYSRLQYVLVDYSESILQGAEAALKEHRDRILVERCDLSKSLPQRRNNILLIRFNELYDDLPDVDIIAKDNGHYYKLFLEPVSFIGGESESSDKDGFIQIRKKDGRLLSLDEFVRDYLGKEGTSIHDLDYDSIRSHIGKIRFRIKLVEIDITTYPYGNFVKEFLKDKEKGRLPINIGALRNLMGALNLIDAQKQGYVQFFDYGFTQETYDYWVEKGKKMKPFLELNLTDNIVYYDKQPTVKLNFPFLIDALRRLTGIEVVSDTQIAYLGNIRGIRFAPKEILTPKKPVKKAFQNRYDDEDEYSAPFLSSFETYVDYLPSFEDFRNKDEILKVIEQFSSEWKENDVRNRRKVWLGFLTVLEERVYKKQLPGEIKNGMSYTEDGQKHSVLGLQSIKDAFELSVRLLVDKELNDLHDEKEKAKAFWVTDEEIRNLPLIKLFFMEDAVIKLIDWLFKNMDESINRFIHFRVAVRGTEVNTDGIDSRANDQTPPASESQKASSSISDKGGIDFRGLPIVTQPMPVNRLSSSPVMPLSNLNINLNTEWGQIQNMLNAGIIPSSERIKEYLIVCCKNGDFNQEIDKVLSCIANILRLQEDNCCATESSFREILSLLESGKSTEELTFALANITPQPQELKAELSP